MCAEILLCSTKRFRTKNITLFGCRLLSSYCVHCCCAGRVLKLCRPYPSTKVKDQKGTHRRSSREDYLGAETHRYTSVYMYTLGWCVCVCVCGAENILYYVIRCVRVCVLYCTQYYIILCTMYPPIQKILYFYAFQCDRCGGRRHYNNNNTI